MTGATKKPAKIRYGLILDTLPIANFLVCLSSGVWAFRDNKPSVVTVSVLTQAVVILIHFDNFVSLELMPDQSSPRPVGEDDPQARFREPLKNLPVYSAIVCAAFQMIQCDPQKDSGGALLILCISALLHTAFIQHKSAQRCLGAAA